MLTFFLLLILAGCIAALWREGLWTSMLSLLNAFFSALIATNYYESFAQFLEGMAPSYTYFCDFIAIWLLFFLCASILQTATFFLSRNQVYFSKPVELGGKIFFSAWLGWIMVCFTCMTLHLAPLSSQSFAGGFQPKPNSTHFLGLSPDKLWLGLIHSRSAGTFSRSDRTRNQSQRVFDRQGDFIFKYHSRRQALDQSDQLRVTRK